MSESTGDLEQESIISSCFTNKRECLLVLKQIILNRSKLLPEERKALRIIIGDIGGGFRDSLKAPDGVLIQKLDGICNKSLETREILLFLWFAINETRMAPVTSFLASKKPTEIIPQITEITSELSVANPELTIDEIDIAIRYLISKPKEELSGNKGSESTQEKNRTNIKTCFNVWLEEASFLDSSSVEWEGLDEFIASLKNIASVKAEERAKSHRHEELKNELVTILGKIKQRKDILVELMLECNGWEASLVKEDCIEEVINQLNTFDDKLTKYSELKLLEAKSPQQKVKNKHKEADLHEELITLQEAISHYFTISLKTPAPRSEVSEIPIKIPSKSDTVCLVLPPSVSTEQGKTIILDNKENISDAEPALIPPATINIQKPSSTMSPTVQEEVNVSKVEQKQQVEKLVHNLQKTDKESVLWQLINTGDVEGAYWLAMAISKKGVNPPIPLWLLKSLIASAWLARDYSRVENELFAITQKYNLIKNDQSILAIQSGSAMLTSLIHPASGMIGWLSPLPSPFNTLNNVIEEISEFVSSGLTLNPDDIADEQGQNKLESDISEVSNKAKVWLSGALSRSFVFNRPKEIFRRIANSHSGSLGIILEMVSNDNRAEIDDITALITEWFTREQIQQIIKKIELELNKKTSTKPIEGKALKQLVNEIQSGVEIVYEWLYAVHRYETTEKQGDWYRSHNRNLVEKLRFSIPAARTSVQHLITDNNGLHSGPAVFLIRRLDELERFVNLQTIGNMDIPPFAESGLDAGITYRLLQVSSLNLDSEEDGFPYPGNNDWGIIEEALIKVPEVIHSPLELLAVRLGNEDFRWVNDVLETISEKDRPKSKEMINQSWVKFSEIIDRKINDVKKRVDQAILQGIVDHDIRTSSEFTIARLTEQIKSTDPQNVSRYCVMAQLNGVLRDINECRTKVLKEKKEEWESVKRNLNHIIPSANREPFIRLIENAFANNDIYLIDEAFSIARRLPSERSDEEIMNLITTQNKPDSAERDYLGEINIARIQLPDILKAGLRELESAILSNSAPPPLHLSGVPEKSRAQIAQSVRAWRELKTGQGELLDQNGHSLHLWALMNYLGFRLTPDSIKALQPQEKERGWSHWKSTMSAEPLSPVQQFGSERKGSFDILCLWERPGLPGVDTILKKIKLDDTPLLLVYLGQLSQPQLESFSKRGFAGNRQVLIIDELLLLYLAQFSESRLEAFFSCTLPATRITPYLLNAAGPMPYEMFYGRQNILRELQDPGGPCLLYGGRQLGKSSILRQIKHDFTSRGQYAILDDIKQLGSEGIETADGIWIRIAKKLDEVKLWKGGISTDTNKMRTKLDEIIKGLLLDPSKRIIILLDEADNFLANDAEEGFMRTSHIKSLVDANDRRLKVIFAGLHNVRRFNSYPNQPLAHFGTPQVVGPLEPVPARDLIVRPMGAVGFRFNDPAVVLKILSLTNYHPGLIQIFCYRMIEHIRRRSPSFPYVVTSEDVEAIYRNSQLQEEISERFGWTLSLDEYYGVITRAVVIDQIEKHDGFSHDYSLSELRKLSEYWWPNGFTNLANIEFQEYVNELKDLWVFTQNNQGLYRLRSPNVARLLGSRDDIETSILVLSEKAGSKKDLGPSIHPMIPDKSKSYSPLSLSQLHNIGFNKSGLTLLFGSKLTGVESISSTLQRYSETNGAGPSCYTTVKLSGQDNADIKQRIANISNNGEGANGILATSVTTGMEADLRSQVSAALKATKNIPKKISWLRIVVIISDESIVEWFKIPSFEREELEKESTIISLGCWQETAIEHLLMDNNITHNADSLKSIVEATGGFQWLLEQFILKYHSYSDQGLKFVIQSFAQEIKDKTSVLNLSFCSKLSLDPLTKISKAFRLISNLQNIPKWELRADVNNLIAGELHISEEETNNILLSLERLGVLNCDDDKIKANLLGKTLMSET